MKDKELVKQHNAEKNLKKSKKANKEYFEDSTNLAKKNNKELEKVSSNKE